MSDSITAELRDWHHYEMWGKTFVVGKIHGDARQRFPDGYEVRTSYLKRVEGDVVHTYSGSAYRLVGPPLDGFSTLDPAKFNTHTE